MRERDQFHKADVKPGDEHQELLPAAAARGLQKPCFVCSSRMFGDSVIPLPHIYGARIKGVEVFCPLDPPPPYEAVAASQADPSQVSMSNQCATNNGVRRLCRLLLW